MFYRHYGWAFDGGDFMGIAAFVQWHDTLVHGLCTGVYVHISKMNVVLTSITGFVHIEIVNVQNITIPSTS